MITTQFVQYAVMDIGKSIAGVSIANALDLPKKLDFGNSFVGRNGTNGTIAFLTSDVIDYVSGKGSKLLNMKYYGAIDEVLFYSLISGGAEVAGVDNGLYGFVKNTFGLSDKNSATATDSIILSGSRVAARYIDGQDLIPSYIRSLRYPIQTLMGVEVQH